MIQEEHSRFPAMKKRVAFVSLLVSIVLAALKFVAATISGSLGMLSEAIQTILDVLATGVTWLTVRVADKPADDNHPWGHGKFESVTAFIQCGMLFGVAIWILLEAAQRFMNPAADIVLSPLVIGILIGSVVVDFWRSRALKKVAKLTGSQALEADALHFTTDMFSSIVVLAGLVASVMGYLWADALAAACVACFILHAAFSLGRRTFDVLVDAAPQEVTEDIQARVAKVSGVLSLERVRVRSTGSSYAVDITAQVNRALSLENVALIQQAIESAITAVYTDAFVVVNTVPVSPTNESLATRVRTLAAHNNLAVHNITVQHLEERIFVGADLELDASLSLVDAHVLASRFEAYVAHDLGPDVDVETHIEPLNPESHETRVAPATLHELLQQDLVHSAYELGDIVQEVHNVRVRDSEEGLLVHFHARLDPAMSVRDAHQAIDAVERRIRQKHTSVLRVVGHAEPLKVPHP